MFKALLAWGATSLAGHLVVSFLAVALPLFLLGLITNIHAGYPPADLGMLIVLPVLASIPVALSFWYTFTIPRNRRRAAKAKRGAQRDL